MSPKRMTIEDLAIMVARSFEAVDKRFEDLQKRMDQKFDEVDRRFVAVDKRFDDLEEKIEQKYGGQTEKLRDDMRIVKTKLKL